MELHIYSDGASRGNPGPAGGGFVIYSDDGVSLREGRVPLGQTTNNVAEYTALLEAAKSALEFKPERLIFFLDSELVVKQMKGEYKVKKEHLREIKDQITDTLKGVPADFRHVPRAQNKVADKLANEAIDGKGGE
ncbi:ribonuclease HI family protein [Limisalsivibrio acetivorans]|uniref:ribonuclease HI family protein n=1 Tax=Limisalsivibrio acetivorans TaxID=1304888 RepID=UPI0003B4AB16|nr:ribonuclease HI family protein [Limisalsivibrio acetivorans]